MVTFKADAHRTHLIAASDEELLALAHNLSDSFRAHDWYRRLQNASPPDLTDCFARFPTFQCLQNALASVEITLVLTSHPSEIRPPSVLEALAQTSIAGTEQEIRATLHAIVPKVNSERPTVADEVEMLVRHFERVLCDGVIDHVQRVKAAMESVFPGVSRPGILPCVIHFHTWIGADRDGNPALTAETTYAAGSRLRGAVLARYQMMLNAIRNTQAESLEEPLALLLEQCQLLLDTPTLRLENLQECLVQMKTLPLSSATQEQLERFDIALSIFGLHLATLEWRENSSVILSEDTEDLCASLRALTRLRAENGAAAVGALLLSNCESVDAIFALERLARTFGVFDAGAIPVVPLLESIAALRAAPQMMEKILENVHMRELCHKVNNRLQVMLGYSDAAKDGGRLMADDAIRQAQSAIVAVALRYGCIPYIFHGRGGSPARGYVEIHESFANLDPGLPGGLFKQTEQGEVVANRYGHTALAAATLDHWVMAALNHYRAMASKRGGDVQLLLRLAAHAYRVYRALREAPDFLDHLFCLTPLADVCGLPLSSRPAVRIARGEGTPITLERLRAIPLSFAMNIAQIPLLAWYGTGSALEGELQDGGASGLTHLYAQSSAFRLSLNCAARALGLSDLQWVREKAALLDRPSVYHFVEQLEAEASRLHTACVAIGVPVIPLSLDKPEAKRLWDLVYAVMLRAPSLPQELAATTFSAVAGAIGMTG